MSLHPYYYNISSHNKISTSYKILIFVTYLLQKRGNKFDTWDFKIFKLPFNVSVTSILPVSYLSLRLHSSLLVSDFRKRRNNNGLSQSTRGSQFQHSVPSKTKNNMSNNVSIYSPKRFSVRRNYELKTVIYIFWIIQLSKVYSVIRCWRVSAHYPEK